MKSFYGGYIMDKFKQEMWQEFLKTGDPSFYMMYRSMGGKDEGIE